LSNAAGEQLAIQQLTDFKSEQIWNFCFTRNGRDLVCARGTTTSDVVMISESK